MLFKFIKRLVFGKDLSEHLLKQKAVRIHGVRFVIKRIDPLNYMDGSRVMAQSFAKYKVDKGAEAGKEIEPKIKTDEIRKHYIDTFMAGVVSPALARKEPKEGELLVDHLMTDWALANDLYSAITELTYGKKKIKRTTSRMTK